MGIPLTTSPLASNGSLPKVSTVNGRPRRSYRLTCPKLRRTNNGSHSKRLSHRPPSLVELLRLISPKFRLAVLLQRYSLPFREPRKLRTPFYWLKFQPP